jgi:small conductance mechanosensitive channel
MIDSPDLLLSPIPGVLTQLTAPLIEHGLEVALVLISAWSLSRALQFVIDRRARRPGGTEAWMVRHQPLLRLAIWSVGTTVAVAVLFTASLEVFLILTVPFGIGLGLASRDIIRNLIAGVIVGIDREFEIGDVIRIQDIEGEVTSIGLRALKVRHTDGHVVEVPNSHLLAHAVSNVTPDTSDAQTRIEITLPGDTEVALARRIAYLAAAVSRYASPRRAPEVFVDTPFDRVFLVRLTVVGFVFDPAYEDHYRSDVIEMVRERLASDPVFDNE